MRADTYVAKDEAHLTISGPRQGLKAHGERNKLADLKEVWASVVAGGQTIWTSMI